MGNKYCYSWDGKKYDNGTFDNAQAALDEAIKESFVHQAEDGKKTDYVYIAEAMTYQNSSFYPDADLIIEHMALEAHDKGGDYAIDYPDFDKNAKSELNQMLHKVLDKWCAKHNISPSFYQVGDSHAVKYCLTTAKPIK